MWIVVNNRRKSVCFFFSLDNERVFGSDHQKRVSSCFHGKGVLLKEPESVDSGEYQKKKCLFLFFL